jgi:hypothetical protein
MQTRKVEFSFRILSAYSLDYFEEQSVIRIQTFQNPYSKIRCMIWICLQNLRRLLFFVKKITNGCKILLSNFPELIGSFFSWVISTVHVYRKKGRYSTGSGSA